MNSPEQFRKPDVTLTKPDGSKLGFWCCPTPGCDGKGFGFDIFPTDPNYDDGNLSFISDDDDDEHDDEGDDYFEDEAERDVDATRRIPARRARPPACRTPSRQLRFPGLVAEQVIASAAANHPSAVQRAGRVPASQGTDIRHPELDRRPIKLRVFDAMRAGSSSRFNTQKVKSCFITGA